jgi:heme-binding NEAT domain protein
VASVAGNSNMSKLLSLAAFAAVLFLAPSFVVAEEKVTIEGDGLCAKCALEETESCQNAVIVTKDGKKTTYYLAKNDVATNAHKSIGFCGASKEKPVKVKVVGTAEKKDDKWIFTAENIKKAD